ncbi:MAG: hypothetical protein AAGJ46_08160 [Planctomycetota bacterium]
MIRQALLLPCLTALSVLPASLSQADYYFGHAHYAAIPDLGMRTAFTPQGEQVIRVRPGGIACQMGLERGDIIVRVNRFAIDCPNAFGEALAFALERGGFLRLTYLQGCTGRLATAQAHLPVVGRTGFRGGFGGGFAGPTPRFHEPILDPRFRNEQALLGNRIDNRGFFQSRGQFGGRGGVAALPPQRVDPRFRDDGRRGRENGRVTIDVGRVFGGLLGRL